MANLAESLIGAGLNFKGAKDQQKAAEAAAAKRMNLIKSLDFTPTYTSDLAPTYQRTQAPVARSWIESFLSGNNPDAISPVSPNAAIRKQQAQAQQNAMFGTPQQRVAQQRTIEQQTPWAVTTPTRTIGTNPAEKKEAGWRDQFRNPGAVEKGGVSEGLTSAIMEAAPKFKDRLGDAAYKARAIVKEFGSPEAALAAVQNHDPRAMGYLKSLI
jgi:hypothetical protein